ncbi:hypothetical protein F511_35085 [Dorcoceras hygrometricum]|uniref:Uncharacterized protein n=1 Tax=Dorcoceras hygrometricum TaxID=472368 RepID=A0A2Z7ARL4_9LAMI|nr:hypothetical protein F511_35085 [Dorcoceras hygrometricum]
MADEFGTQNHDNDIVQPSILERRRARPVEDEVDHLAHQVDEMELVLAIFHGMNLLDFTGAEGGLVADGCLEHMEGLFDRVHYDADRRLSLAIFQLRDHASDMVEEYF